MHMHIVLDLSHPPVSHWLSAQMEFLGPRRRNGTRTRGIFKSGIHRTVKEMREGQAVLYDRIASGGGIKL